MTTRTAIHLPGERHHFDTGGTVLDWHSGIRSALTATGEWHGLVRDWAAITNTYRRHSLQRMTCQVRPVFNIDYVHRSPLVS